VIFIIRMDIMLFSFKRTYKSKFGVWAGLAVMSITGLAGTQSASASVVAVNIGTGNPPSSLGAYTMSAYDPGTIAGAIQAHETDGSGDDSGMTTWNTWGQNYTGNVYVADGDTSLAIALTGSTSAVDFYEEPDQFNNFYMTATDSSGASVTTEINGDAGSAGVGFYETTSGSYLTSISVSATDPDGFAVGEFGISGGNLTGSVGNNVPEPASVGVLAFGAVGLLARRRRQA
jgi:hypothetical protein